MALEQGIFLKVQDKRLNELVTLFHMYRNLEFEVLQGKFSRQEDTTIARLRPRQYEVAERQSHQSLQAISRALCIIL